MKRYVICRSQQLILLILVILLATELIGHRNHPIKDLFKRHLGLLKRPKSATKKDYQEIHLDRQKKAISRASYSRILSRSTLGAKGRVGMQRTKR
jgi:hypothetical protein